MSAIRLRSPLLSGELVIRRNDRKQIRVPLSFERNGEADRGMDADDTRLVCELIAYRKKR